MKYLFLSYLFFILSGCGEQSGSPQENKVRVVQNSETTTQDANMSTQLSDSLKMYYTNALDKNSTALKSSLYNIISQSKFLTYKEAYSALDFANKDLSSRDEDSIILFYSQNIVAASAKCHTVAPDGCWNREHLWPKSLGVGYDDSIASYTDLHHLQPTDAKINADRGNRRFANSSTPYRKIDNFFYDDSNWSWEVADNLKGDVARAILYMVIRYEGENGEPDLELYAHDESYERPADLCLMLEWNREDRVSNSEIRRNDIIFQYQKNRNPFIDKNEWVDIIWKSECIQ